MADSELPDTLIDETYLPPPERTDLRDSYRLRAVALVRRAQPEDDAGDADWTGRLEVWAETRRLMVGGSMYDAWVAGDAEWDEEHTGDRSAVEDALREEHAALNADLSTLWPDP